MLPEEINDVASCSTVGEDAFRPLGGDGRCHLLALVPVLRVREELRLVLLVAVKACSLDDKVSSLRVVAAHTNDGSTHSLSVLEPSLQQP